MCKKLVIKPTQETPEIVLDPQRETFLIEGRSMPEDPKKFYHPILNWFETYKTVPNEKTELEINLEYLNSGSLKQVINVIYIIEEILDAGHDVNVIWKHKPGDELMRQKGLEFQNFLEVPVQIIES